VHTHAPNGHDATSKSYCKTAQMDGAFETYQILAASNSLVKRKIHRGRVRVGRLPRSSGPHARAGTTRKVGQEGRWKASTYRCEFAGQGVRRAAFILRLKLVGPAHCQQWRIVFVSAKMSRALRRSWQTRRSNSHRRHREGACWDVARDRG